MGGDEHVHRTDGLPGTFKVGPYVSVMQSGLVVEREDLQGSGERE